MHTVFALLCFVVVIHWLIFPYPSGLLHWHCGNLTIAPVPAKQPWWIWINDSCEFIMNDCITTTKQSTTNPCAYFSGYTVGVRRAAVTALISKMGYMFPPKMHQYIFLEIILTVDQHRFRWRLGAVRHQAITWTNDDLTYYVTHVLLYLSELIMPIRASMQAVDRKAH